jgi:ribosomal-protein-alanine N-acetyltransferase
MEALEGAARGRAETAWLEVRRDNEAAIGLYASMGWGPAGLRPRYYGDGCDALLMRKRL